MSAMELEIFGQTEAAAVTTPFIFVYPLPDPTALPTILASLEQGLQRLAEAFPWTAGKIVRDANSGLYQIQSQDSRPSVILTDHRGKSGVPTFQQLESADFPIALLDEEFFSAIRVLPGTPDEDRSRVLTVHINQLDGGLVVNLIANHQALDGTGQDQIAYLLDKACHDIPYTDEELRIGNMQRRNIVKLLPDEWQPPADTPYLPRSTSSTGAPAAVNDSKAPPVAVWANFAFSGQAQVDLKKESSRQIASGYISTNDALNALIWQSIARARSARLPPETKCTLGRAIDPRRYCDIPTTYPGYISNFAYSTRTLASLSSAQLVELASELRAAIDPDRANLGQATRELATLMHRAENKSTVSVAANLDLDSGIMLSSWTHLRCYSFDFNLGLGKPVAFRRPRMVPVPSLMYLLPRRTDGEVVLCICLRSDDLDALKEDSSFNSYARFIG